MGILANGLILINISAYVQLVIEGIVLIAAVGFDSNIKEQERDQGKGKQRGVSEQSTVRKIRLVKPVMIRWAYDCHLNKEGICKLKDWAILA